MDLQLSGKVVLVTGGSEGLGAAVGQRLVQEGARVALCARDPERLEATAARLRALGGEVLAVPADVSRASDVERFVAAAHERWGRVDALVNNAGSAAAKAFLSVTDAEWEEDLQLKLFAAMRAVRLVVPHLRAAGGGSILNVLSIKAKEPGKNTTPSSVSRAAGMALMKVLSKELGPDNIRVNAILPGLVAGDRQRRVLEAKAQQRGISYAEMERTAFSYTSIKDYVTPEQIADQILFMCSPRGSTISGQAISICGDTQMLG